MNTYDKGDKVRLQAVFKNISAEVADPTTVKFLHKDPGGTLGTYTYGGTFTEIVKAATGTYYTDFTFDETGVWNYRWEGSGSIVTAEEEKVLIRESAFY